MKKSRVVSRDGHVCCHVEMESRDTDYSIYGVDVQNRGSAGPFYILLTSMTIIISWQLTLPRPPEMRAFYIAPLHLTWRCGVVYTFPDHYQKISLSQIRSDSLIRLGGNEEREYSEPFCPTLSSLRLNSNELKNIPLWMIRAFPFLKILNLSKNSIQFLPDQSLGTFSPSPPRYL